MSVASTPNRQPPVSSLTSPEGTQVVEQGTLPQVVETLSDHRTSLVGGLSSAIVHMVLLITLGLFFVATRPTGTLDLEMTLANTSASESIETFSMDEQPEQADQSNSQLSHTPPPIIEIDEPELVTEFGDFMASDEAFDPSTLLDAPVNSPGGKSSGTESGKTGTFFGADAYGDKFVYVVDMSTSMGYRSEYGRTRFRVACRELLRSINQLKPDQKFCVIMFCYRTRVMFDQSPRLISATQANKLRLANWVGALGLGGGTDPRFGTQMALQLRPDAIFLLSDGEFNGRDVNAHGIRGNAPIETIIQRERKTAVPIHTIAFEDLLNRRRLRRIASATSGTHRFVGNVSDQQLVLTDLQSSNLSDVAYGMNCLLEGTHKLRDERHLKWAVKAIGDKFTSKEVAIREKAHETMLFLSQGEDLGPVGPTPTVDEYADAQREWRRYWAERFRTTRAERANREEIRRSALGDVGASL